MLNTSLQRQQFSAYETLGREIPGVVVQALVLVEIKDST